jgi:hypothetical protein
MPLHPEYPHVHCAADPECPFVAAIPPLGPENPYEQADAFRFALILAEHDLLAHDNPLIAACELLALAAAWETDPLKANALTHTFRAFITIMGIESPDPEPCTTWEAPHDN